nr:hypothetical protein [Tanacetum cinerariifolium]
MASDQNSSDPAPECQTMASDQNSFDLAPKCQTMASDQNSSDPAPECQTMASNQNSSDPAPECQTMALNHDSLSPAIQDHPLEQVIGNPLQPVKTRRQLESDAEMCMFVLTDFRSTNPHELSLSTWPKLESLFGPSFDEYFNGENQVVSKSSVDTTADTTDKRQQQPDSTSSTSTLATTVTVDGNFDL